MNNSRRTLLRIHSLLTDKRIYEAISKNVSGSRQDSTLNVIGNTCLIASAILKTFGYLIETNKLIRIQRLLKLINYNISLVMSRAFSLNQWGSATKPTNTNITGAVNSQYIINKYIINTPYQIELSNLYKDNVRLSRGIFEYATILRKHYSYISSYRSFSGIYTSVSYIPDILTRLERLPSKLTELRFELCSGSTNKSHLLKSISLDTIDQIQLVNNFLSRLFTDCAVIGGHSLIGILARNSSFCWHWASKFWFANIALSIIKYFIEHETLSSTEFRKISPGVDRIFLFFGDNKDNIVKLFLAYHWGFDWSFLNDYQLSLLNFNSALPAFMSNWKEVFDIIKQDSSTSC
ncbi:hypothetical protein DASC09_022530 [Saccharomycopsis crataegensis]|uniref:Uncharacterized protein n=1 Tax=Saccharomycopsis crataegensis TaxID=43959 RepID=A0AAV5QJH1_9ASCO|nr:hypothetical protein DASC09_022530 [Saccharomycopsis crataegensis]